MGSYTLSCDGSSENHCVRMSCEPRSRTGWQTRLRRLWITYELSSFTQRRNFSPGLHIHHFRELTTQPQSFHGFAWFAYLSHYYYFFLHIYHWKCLLDFTFIVMRHNKWRKTLHRLGSMEKNTFKTNTPLLVQFFFRNSTFDSRDRSSRASNNTNRSKYCIPINH